MSGWRDKSYEDCAQVEIKVDGESLITHFIDDDELRIVTRVHKELVEVKDDHMLFRWPKVGVGAYQSAMKVAEEMLLEATREKIARGEWDD